MVAASDGVPLCTDHYAPDAPGPHPTLLMRTPYGRNSFGTIARCYAERGFNVVIQACRGTEKSGGQFNPLVNEREDGLATLRWLHGQPWFDGRLGLTGPSYLGYAHWAICDAPGIDAMSIKVSSAEFRSVVFPAGAFHLGLWLSWLQTIEGLRTNAVRVFRRMVTGSFERRTAKAAQTLPLVEADVAAVGHQVWFWRHWFDHAFEEGAFWDAIDHRPRIGPATPPCHLMSGWYDFMLDQLLRDYRALVEAGRQPYLTVSCSTHITDGHDADNPVDTLAWMRAHLMGDRSGLRDNPVRIQIGGTGEWHEYESFPPAPVMQQNWYLGAGATLGKGEPEPSPPDTYRYDPGDPTPNLGGAIFAFTGAGPVNQARLEARPDVRCYTSPALCDDLLIVGNVRVTLHARASIQFVDFLVRLSDVDARGVSVNVCDGFTRMSTPPEAADGVWQMTFDMHATAYRFRAGHRLRILVASGAYPRYARNLGTGEPLGTATDLIPADVEIFHDPLHASAVALPVVPGR